MNQQQQTQQIPPVLAIGASTLTSQSRTVVICAQNCLSTNEYNPVCGSDSVLYNNIRRLECTNKCGRTLDPSNWQGIMKIIRKID